MSDQQGLSIFDSGRGPAETTQLPPAGGTGELPVVRRGGYDRAAVDARIRDLQAAVANAERAAGSRVTRLEQQVNDLRTQLAEAEQPTYAGLGGRAASLLTMAEDQADEVLSRARAQADELLTSAQRESEALRATAAKEVDDMKVVQLQDLEDQRARLTAAAEDERAAASAQASDLLASAKREADQIRLAAEQETTSMRTSAKRDTEKARAAADREVSEARRVLAVERERLTREAADAHTQAVEETQRLVRESEERAAAAEQRATEASAQARKQREDAAAESERTLARARREAEQVVAAARNQADHMSTQAQADLDRRTAAARAELDIVQRRRDGIVAQLASLRDLVAGFGPGEAAEGPATDDDLELDPPFADARSRRPSRPSRPSRQDRADLRPRALGRQPGLEHRPAPSGRSGRHPLAADPQRAHAGVVGVVGLPELVERVHGRSQAVQPGAQAARQRERLSRQLGAVDVDPADRDALGSAPMALAVVQRVGRRRPAIGSTLGVAQAEAHLPAAHRHRLRRPAWAPQGVPGRGLEVPVVVSGMEQHAAGVSSHVPPVDRPVEPAVAVPVPEQDLAGVLLAGRAAPAAVRADLQDSVPHVGESGLEAQHPPAGGVADDHRLGRRQGACVRQQQRTLRLGGRQRPGRCGGTGPGGRDEHQNGGGQRGRDQQSTRSHQLPPTRSALSAA